MARGERLSSSAARLLGLEPLILTPHVGEKGGRRHRRSSAIGRPGFRWVSPAWDLGEGGSCP